MVALALPDMMRMRSSNAACPGCRAGVTSWPWTGRDRQAAADDADQRAALRSGAEAVAARGMGVLSDFPLMEVADPESEWVGCSLGEIAEARGTDVIDVLIDTVLVDGPDSLGGPARRSPRRWAAPMPGGRPGWRCGRTGG